MDSKTRERIVNIGKSIPSDLLRGALKKNDPGGIDRDQVKWMLKKIKSTSHRMTLAEAKKTEKRLSGLETIGSPPQYSEIDHGKSDEIEKYVEAKIRKEIRDGRIPPAQKDEFTEKYRRLHDSRRGRSQ